MLGKSTQVTSTRSLNSASEGSFDFSAARSYRESDCVRSETKKIKTLSPILMHSRNIG
jgi:hypothetical protein